jgi:prepilin-type N-terminal cleavage/methylation domain-containing protein
MSMKKPPQGFTLVETMVAIVILVLSVMGPLIAADRAIVAAETARDQLIASYLAQEGIEYMRAVRDDYYLSAYQQGGPTISTTAWADFLNGTLKSCEYPGVCHLGALNTSNGTLAFYANGVTGWTPFNPGGEGTPFTRTIQLVNTTGNWSGTTDVQVVSVVSWSFNGTPYKVTLTDDLTQWE